MRHRALRVAIWLAGLALCVLQVANTRFVADLSSFLPRAPTPEQRLLVDQLREGALSRVVLLGIEGADAATRGALSRALADGLRRDPAFAAVANGAAAGHERERELLFAHRYALSPAVDARRFSVEGLREAVTETVALLASPAGPALKAIVPRDPTGELVGLVERLQSTSGPRVEEGVWVSPDGARALLIARTLAGASDIDAQSRAIASAEAAFAKAVAQSGGKAGQARLVLTGAGVFSVRARAMIESEVLRIGIVAGAFVVILLLAVYRSAAALALGLAPVVTGALAGIAAVSLGHGLVHGITLGFGTTLIGEAVDYSIFLFVQAGRDERPGGDAWIRGSWPTIRLGVATSIAGFAALLLSGLPGLAQLGLYSIVGLIVAALVARYVLPALLPPGLRVRDLSAAGERLATLASMARRLRWAVAVLAAAAVAVLASRPGTLWDTELASLNPIGAGDRKLDAELRAGLAAPDARFMVAVFAPSEDAALAAAEKLGERMDRLVAEGKLAGYESPARFLPSLATQKARRDSLPEAAALRERLVPALAGLPLRAGKLEPFVADVQQAREAPALTRASFRGTALDLALDGLLFADASGRWTALVGLRGVSNAFDPGAIAGAVSASGVPGALFLDLKAEADRLYAGYLEQAVLLCSLGVLAVAAILLVAIRSPRRVARILAPLLASVLVVAALHALAGTRLTIPHLVGLTLIVAIGSNYALFFDRIGERAGPDAARTLASLALANVTTIASFGLLGLSSIPVLNAIGSSVAVGAFLSLVFSAAWSSGSGQPSRGDAAA
jgi:predicted exporter